MHPDLGSAYAHEKFYREFSPGNVLHMKKERRVARLQHKSCRKGKCQAKVAVNMAKAVLVCTGAAYKEGVAQARCADAADPYPHRYTGRGADLLAVYRAVDDQRCSYGRRRSRTGCRLEQLLWKPDLCNQQRTKRPENRTVKRGFIRPNTARMSDPSAGKCVACRSRSRYCRCQRWRHSCRTSAYCRNLPGKRQAILSIAFS